MTEIPKLIRYSNGRFKLVRQSLPKSVYQDQEMQHKILLLVAHKYRSYNWKRILPEDRFKIINDYVYKLVKDEYKD